VRKNCRETHPEHNNKPEIVQTQSWRYKTIVVIKRQQQTTISQKVEVSMESISKILIGNRFHSNFTHRQSLNLQALLTSETLKGPNKGRESKQTQD